MQNKIETLIKELELQRDSCLQQIPLCTRSESKRIFELRIEKLEHRIEQATKLLDTSDYNEEVDEVEMYR